MMKCHMQVTNGLSGTLEVKLKHRGSCSVVAACSSNFQVISEDTVEVTQSRAERKEVSEDYHHQNRS